MLALQWAIVLGLAIIFCVLFAVALLNALPFYGRWLARYPSLGCLLALVLVILFGVVGSEFGLANLFWHERILAQIQAGLGLIFLASILFFFGYLSDPSLVKSGADAASWFGKGVTWAKDCKYLAWRDWVYKGCRAFFEWRAIPTRTMLEPGACLAVMGVPIVSALWASAALAAIPDQDGVGPLARFLRLAGLPLGACFALALVVYLPRMVARSHPNVTWHWRHGWLVVLIFTVTIYVVYLIPWTREYLAASICICLLLSAVALLLFATNGSGLVRLLTIGLSITFLGLMNSTEFKLQYPALEAYYSRPASIGYDREGGADREPELLAEGGTNQSVDYFDRFLEMYPRGSVGIIGRSASLATSGKTAEAWAAVDSLIENRGLVSSTSLCTRGIIELERGQYGRALKDFDRAISEDPRRSIAHVGRGLALIGLTRYKEATESLQKSVTIDPRSEVARISLATALLASNQREPAKITLSKVINDATARIDKARSGNTGENTRQSTASDLYIDHVRRALAYQLQGNPTAAEADLNDAVRLAPDKLGPRLARSGVHMQGKKIRESLADLDWVLNRNEGHAAFGARLNRGMIYLEQNNAEKALPDLTAAVQLDSGSVLALMDYALVLQQLKRPDEAVSALDRAIESDPDGIAALKTRAFLHFAAKRYPSALSDLDQVLKASPASVEGLNNRAGILFEMGEARRAQADLDAALKIDSSDIATIVNKAFITNKGGQHQEALDLLTSALKVVPNDVRLLVNRAILRLGRADARWAFTDFDAALALEPGNVAALINRANAWLIQEQPDRALIDLEEAIKAEPTNVAAHVNLAGAWLNKGEPDKALAAVDAALGMEPTSVPAQITRAGVWMTKGDPDKALTDLDRALLAEPTNVPARVSRAGVWMWKGDADKALGDLQSAIRIEPSYVPALTSRAGVWITKGETDKALADLDAALESQPQNPVALSNRAAVWLTKREPNKALADANRAIQSEPTSAPARTTRAGVWIAMDEIDKALDDLGEVLKSDPRNVPALVMRARVWLSRNEADRALADVNMALKIDPKNVVAMAGRADVWRSKGELDKALAELDAVLIADPSDVPSRVSRALVRQMKGEPDKARTDLDLVLKSNPSDVVALSNRAAIWMSTGDPDKALIDLNAAINADPSNVPARVIRASAWMSKSEPDKALSDLDAAIKSEPTDVPAHLFRADVWMSKGEPDKALTDLDAAIKADPSKAQARVKRAGVWMSRGQPPMALADLDAALKAEPTSVLPLLEMSRIHMTQGALDAAQNAIEKALRIAPNDASILSQSASVHIAKGELEAADVDLASAIKLDPDRAELHALLAEIYKRRGNAQSAQTEALRAAQILERSLSGNMPGTRRGMIPWIKLPPEAPTENLNREGVNATGEKRYDSAINSFTKAITQAEFGDPRAIPALYFNRGMAYALQGQDQRSVADFYAALVRDSALSFALAKPPNVTLSTMPSPTGRVARVLRVQGPGTPSPRALLAMSSRGKATIEIRNAAIESVRPRYNFTFAPSAMLPGRELLLRTEASRLIPDQKALDAWKTHASGISSGKPKIVVVAVSGGGIVASYWTVLCLTQCESRDHDFPYRIRMFAGASGGMVGAGFYVAQLASKTNRAAGVIDYSAYQRNLLNAVAGDSLTPTVRCLILHDIPAAFCWRQQGWDRGRALEEAWVKNTGGVLGQAFASLGPGEEQGWRPSLVVSPTLAEQGRRLLISNLDLSSVEEGTLTSGVQFYKFFPDADSFKLSTALRMNAAFPYVSPAVLLPFQWPRLKVIDAGYLENYGVGFLFDWLHRHRRWLAENTGGIALIQIRAYSPGLREEYKLGVSATTKANEPTTSSTVIDRIGTGMEWLFAPIEGFATAKQAAMLDDNNNKVDQLVQTFRELKPSRGDQRVDFFKTFVFQCEEEAPLGWSITANDRRRLDRIFTDDNAESHNHKELEALLSFLSD